MVMVKHIDMVTVLVTVMVIVMVTVMVKVILTDTVFATVMALSRSWFLSQSWYCHGHLS